MTPIAMYSPSVRPIVSLPVFEGPLDLLLQLIEQQRLDITAVALAQVADQYLMAVRALHDRRPAELADFLVIGARLIVIKTRALLPRPPIEDLRLTEDDVGDQLARQLREYSRYKEIAALLREREAAGLRSHIRPAPPSAPWQPASERLPQLDVDPGRLVAAVERRLQLLRAEDVPPVDLPAPKVVTIAEVAERLRSRLAAHEWVSFDDLLSLAFSRAEVVVTLWTVLELFKRDVVTLEQDRLFEQISIGRGPAFESPIEELDAEG